MSVTFRSTTNDVQPRRVAAQAAGSVRQHFASTEKFAKAFKLPKQHELEPSRTDPNARVIQVSEEDSHIAKLQQKGLVGAVIDAYNSHHNLVLRPDDFWQAILTQFGFYVTGNAEQLRDRFVDFQGKKQLEIHAAGTLFTVDFGELANRMVDEQIVKNIRDQSVVDWLLPAFTTTMPRDRVVASVSVMAALQKYFDYKFSLSCGIPCVTLLGTLEDWQLLKAKVDRLLEFELSGNDCMTKWHGWLTTICESLIASVQGSDQIEFWDRVCSHLGGGSGPSYISGWISVFTVFSNDGGIEQPSKWASQS